MSADRIDPHADTHERHRRNWQRLVTYLRGLVGFPFPKRAAAPSSPVESQCYYNTTTHHAEMWNGTAWKQLDN